MTTPLYSQTQTQPEWDSGWIQIGWAAESALVARGLGDGGARSVDGLHQMIRLSRVIEIVFSQSSQDLQREQKIGRGVLTAQLGYAALNAKGTLQFAFLFPRGDAHGVVEAAVKLAVTLHGSRAPTWQIGLAEVAPKHTDAARATGGLAYREVSIDRVLVSALLRADCPHTLFIFFHVSSPQDVEEEHAAISGFVLSSPGIAASVGAGGRAAKILGWSLTPRAFTMALAVSFMAASDARASSSDGVS